MEATPGPGGRPWGDSTIRGHHERGIGILRNELFIGWLVWNRLRYLKDPTNGKRRSRLNPPSEWLVPYRGLKVGEGEAAVHLLCQLLHCCAILKWSEYGW